MEGTQRVATWLELAAMPAMLGAKPRVRLHPVGGKLGSCFAMSMDGRWLCAGSGELTVFKGLGAALRFLEVLHIDTFEPGEAAGDAACCARSHCCLTAERNRGLTPCRSCVHEQGAQRVRRH